MVDAVGWVTLAIASFTAWVGELPKGAPSECHCNCTCEVVASSPSSSWTWETIKIFVGVLAGLALGTGYLVNGILWLVRRLHVRLVQAPLPCSTTRATSKETVKGLEIEGEEGDQRLLAQQQLQLIRSRRTYRI